MDIKRDDSGEFFEMSLPESGLDAIEANVLQARPRERHLLLMVRGPKPGASIDRFLCGHDEREWFVAAMPGRVSNVAAAMESLKPLAVRAAQAQARLSARQRNGRNNRAFRRQGEWFFVPAPELKADPKLILRNEPIRRGGGKPHLVEMLYRYGGVPVWVCSKYPGGVSVERYRQLLHDKPSRAQWDWRLMRANAAVYARGDIRHADHRTITLPDWHRVLMNTETESRTMSRVAFLD